jgi:predicted phosphodiesterase
MSDCWNPLSNNGIRWFQLLHNNGTHETEKKLLKSIVERHGCAAMISGHICARLAQDTGMLLVNMGAGMA